MLRHALLLLRGEQGRRIRGDSGTISHAAHARQWDASARVIRREGLEHFATQVELALSLRRLEVERASQAVAMVGDERMEQRIMLASIAQPGKVLHDPVVGAGEQVGVASCPEALEPAALQVRRHPGPPRTDLARRGDANDLAPQHIRGIAPRISQRPAVERDPGDCVARLERALGPQRIPAGMGRVSRQRDVEQLVGIGVPLLLDQQLRDARLNCGILSVRLQPLDHLAPTASVPVQREPLVPRISVQRVELDHPLQAFASDPLAVVAAKPKTHVSDAKGGFRIVGKQLFRLTI